MSFISDIQKNLKAPKGQYNAFGKYKYRKCEDILEAVKPLLAEHKAHLIIEDDIILVGDRYYVKAVATVSNGTDKFSATAFAREELEKKGCDASQITGTASSYARKYALNGLFAIDDTDDADAINDHGKSKKYLDFITEISQVSTEAALKTFYDANKSAIESLDEKDKEKVRSAYAAAKKKLVNDII